jgi:hypothetical protein
MYEIGDDPMVECLERPCETGIDLMSASATARMHLQKWAARFGDVRVLLAGLLLVLLSVALLAVLGGGAADAPLVPGETSYSGDDRYDPAAGSLLALLSRSSGNALATSLSGDDDYDPAAGARPETALYRADESLSGDDAYDPAAGSYPALLVRLSGGSLSGDDDYDPAAGARPETALYRADESLSGDDAYDPAAGIHPVLFARSSGGSLSGDDAYDPAAGGTPR